MLGGNVRIAFLSIHGYVDPVPNLGLVDTGGQVVYVLEMAKQLGKLGIQVDIYTRKFEERKGIEDVTENVRIIRIPCGPKEFIVKEKLYPYLGEFAENFIKYVKKNDIKYSLIHSHYWDAGFVAMIIREKLGIPMAHTSHSLGLIKKMFLGEIGKKVDYGFETRINTEKEILRKSDIIISASPIEPELVEKYYGVKRKFHVVPPGVDIDYFDPRAKKTNIQVPKRYVFTTGRIEWTKGFDLLVKAFKHVADAFKEVKLLLGGGSVTPSKIEKEVRKKLSELSKNLKIENKVIQLGRIPNELLPAYYAKSSVVVLPSRYDLFGMVALEALACARPVVVSKYAGVHKLIKKEFGRIVDPNDEEEFGKSILELIMDKEKADSMGQAGRRYIEENLTWPNLAKKLNEIYEGIL